jgi:hypothetical protein
VSPFPNRITLLSSLSAEDRAPGPQCRVAPRLRVLES